MAKRVANKNNMPDHIAGGNKASDRRSPVRFFLWFLLVFILLSGFFVLATNGLYYWQCRPITEAYNEARHILQDGVPPEATEKQERLSYYQSIIDSLSDLPSQLAALDNQAWTFAVLLREDFQQDIPELLTQAEKGQKAVSAYFEAVGRLESTREAFADIGTAPPATAVTLPELIDWYSRKIEVSDQLEEQFNRLSTIEDVDLAGRLFSQAELGLDVIMEEVAPYRLPVVDCKDLLAQSAEVENRLDTCYARDPFAEDQKESADVLTGLITEQNELLQISDGLTDQLPADLSAVFSAWRAALAGRSEFMASLDQWWQNLALYEQSLSSAKIAKATAKRYIADSLAETNVETAYIWTRTAQTYEASMVTAIDFANIYIDRANNQIDNLTASRLAYRPGLGLPINLQSIKKLEHIDQQAFWLED
ncbi:MAG: hypothetical protein ACOX1A_09460 [Saccharofermentanales bacterium]|jgi:hypothetical protein